MKKAIVAALIVGACAVAGGGYVGYDRYVQQQFTASLTPHVKNASLRTQNALRAEIDQPQMTYREYFAKLEEDIAAIGSRTLDIQTLTTEKNKHLSAPAITYLKANQEIMRAMLSASHKSLGLSTAIKMVDDAMSDLRRADGYSARFALNNFNSKTEERDKAAKEYFEATKNVHVTAISLKEAMQAVANIMPPDALIDIALIDEKINATEKDFSDIKVKLPPKAGCRIEQMSWGEQYNCS